VPCGSTVRLHWHRVQDAWELLHRSLVQHERNNNAEIFGGSSIFFYIFCITFFICRLNHWVILGPISNSLLGLVIGHVFSFPVGHQNPFTRQGTVTPCHRRHRNVQMCHRHEVSRQLSACGFSMPL